MMRVLTVARATLAELVRRGVVLALALGVGSTILLSACGFSRIRTFHVAHVQMLQNAASLLTFVIFLFTFIIAMSAAFLAASTVATDVESGLVLGVLSRPIRRIEYIGGKWLGICVAVAVGAAISGGLEIAVVAWATDYVPPHPFIVLAALATLGILVATLAFAFGTRFGALASAIVAVIAFGLEWISGIAGRLAFQFSNDALVNATTAISLALPSDSYWRAAQWAVQPAVFTAALNTREGIARAGPFAGAVPPTTAMLVWTALWIVAVLGVAMRAFARRDL